MCVHTCVNVRIQACAHDTCMYAHATHTHTFVTEIMSHAHMHAHARTHTHTLTRTHTHAHTGTPAVGVSHRWEGGGDWLPRVDGHLGRPQPLYSTLHRLVRYSTPYNVYILSWECMNGRDRIENRSACVVSIVVVINHDIIFLAARFHGREWRCWKHQATYCSLITPQL